MFVKQISEAELNEYERALQGTVDSVKQLAGNDQSTGEAIYSVVEACEVLQTLLREQVASYHDEAPEPEHKPAPPED